MAGSGNGSGSGRGAAGLREVIARDGNAGDSVVVDIKPHPHLGAIAHRRSRDGDYVNTKQPQGEVNRVASNYSKICSKI